MKKYFLLLTVSLFFVSMGNARAEDSSANTPASSPEAVVAEAPAAKPAENSPAVTPTPAVSAPADTVAAVPAPAMATAESTTPVSEKPAAVSTGTVVQEPVVPAEPAADNLEFISGEISALDEASKTLTVKLYGESGSGATDKTLSVKVNEATDITDGEKDRDLRSLVAGTEVDVEYDPVTKKATYIFVY